MTVKEEIMDWLSHKVNRSKGQLELLFYLCGEDFLKLCHLESNIKNCHIRYCPATKEKVEEILNMIPNNKWFELHK